MVSDWTFQCERCMRVTAVDAYVSVWVEHACVEWPYRDAREWVRNRFSYWNAAQNEVVRTTWWHQYNIQTSFSFYLSRSIFRFIHMNGNGQITGGKITALRLKAPRSFFIYFVLFNNYLSFIFICIFFMHWWKFCLSCMPPPNTVFLLWTCPFLQFSIDEWSRCECEANAAKTNINAINLYPPIYNNNSNKHKMDIWQKLWITAYPFEWNTFLYLCAGFEF